MGEVIYGVVFAKPKIDGPDFYAECRRTGGPASPDKLSASDPNAYVTREGDIFWKGPPVDLPSDTEPPNESA